MPRTSMPWGRLAAEFVVIVVGVLVALGVDSWVENRGDRQAEVESLQLLGRDLEEAIAQLEEFHGVVDATGAAALRVYKALSDSESLDTVAVSNDLLRLVVRRSVRLSRAAYTDLLSTGNIRVIRDVALRDGIARFYENVERAEAIILLNNSNAVDEHAAGFLLGEGWIIPRPRRVGYAVVDSAFVRIEDALGHGFAHPPDLIWQLPESHQVWNRVRTLGLHLARNSSVQREVAEGVLEEARALRTMIGEHLEAR